MLVAVVTGHQIADTREKQLGGERSSLQHCSTAGLSLCHHLEMYAMITNMKQMKHKQIK